MSRSTFSYAPCRIQAGDTTEGAILKSIFACLPLSLWQIVRQLSIIKAEREWLRIEQCNGKTYKVRFISLIVYKQDTFTGGPRAAHLQCHEPCPVPKWIKLIFLSDSVSFLHPDVFFFFIKASEAFQTDYCYN